MEPAHEIGRFIETIQTQELEGLSLFCKNKHGQERNNSIQRVVAYYVIHLEKYLV